MTTQIKAPVETSTVLQRAVATRNLFAVSLHGLTAAREAINRAIEQQDKAHASLQKFVDLLERIANDKPGISAVDLLASTHSLDDLTKFLALTAPTALSSPEPAPGTISPEKLVPGPQDRALDPFLAPPGPPKSRSKPRPRRAPEQSPNGSPAASPVSPVSLDGFVLIRSDEFCNCDNPECGGDDLIYRLRDPGEDAQITTEYQCLDCGHRGEVVFTNDEAHEARASAAATRAGDFEFGKTDPQAWKAAKAALASSPSAPQLPEGQPAGEPFRGSTASAPEHTQSVASPNLPAVPSQAAGRSNPDFPIVQAPQVQTQTPSIPTQTSATPTAAQALEEVRALGVSGGQVAQSVTAALAPSVASENLMGQSAKEIQEQAANSMLWRCKKCNAEYLDYPETCPRCQGTAFKALSPSRAQVQAQIASASYKRTVAPIRLASPNVPVVPPMPTRAVAAVAPSESASHTVEVAPTRLASPGVLVAPVVPASPSVAVAPKGIASPNTSVAPAGLAGLDALVAPIVTASPQAKVRRGRPKKSQPSAAEQAGLCDANGDPILAPVSPSASATPYTAASQSNLATPSMQAGHAKQVAQISSAGLAAPVAQETLASPSPEVQKAAQRVLSFEPPPVDVAAMAQELRRQIAEWTLEKLVKEYESLTSKKFAPGQTPPDTMAEEVVQAILGVAVPR